MEYDIYKSHLLGKCALIEFELFQRQRVLVSKENLLVSSFLRKRRADREPRAEKWRICALKRTQITKFSPYLRLASRLKDVHALVM